MLPFGKEYLQNYTHAIMLQEEILYNTIFGRFTDKLQSYCRAPITFSGVSYNQQYMMSSTRQSSLCMPHESTTTFTYHATRAQLEQTKISASSKVMQSYLYHQGQTQQGSFNIIWHDRKLSLTTINILELETFWQSTATSELWHRL